MSSNTSAKARKDFKPPFVSCLRFRTTWLKGRQTLRVGLVGWGTPGPNLMRSLVGMNPCDQICWCKLARTTLAKVVRRFPTEWLGPASKLTLVRNPSLLQTRAMNKSISLRLQPPRSMRAHDFLVRQITGCITQLRHLAPLRRSAWGAPSTAEIPAGALTCYQRNSHDLNKRCFDHPRG